MKLHHLILLANFASASLQTQCRHDAVNPLASSPTQSPLEIDSTTRPPFPPNIPWTHPPFCTAINNENKDDQEFCIFSSNSFNLGTGLSILLPPETVAGLTSTISNIKPHWDERVHLAKEAHNSDRPYTLIKIPGQGTGVVATRKIKQFETIMTGFPAVIIDNEFFPEDGKAGNVSDEEKEELYDELLERIGDKERVLSLARSRGDKVHVLEDVVRTNAFGMTLDGRKAKGLFPEIARMNHACDPNAYAQFRSRTLSLSAVATRDIMPGEEITISYIPIGMSTAYRHKHLSNWHFNCTCALCSAPEQAREASDARREHIIELFYGMQEPSTTYEDLIEMTKEFIELAQVERLITKIGEYYQVLMKLFYEKGDPVAARKYGKAALMFGEIFSDPDGEFCEGLREDMEIVERVISETGGQ
ncbi:hypothetical protein QBC38DRAFT_367425 [Podospora fimiseda]|uniref:SET domain-containing protein n=1 Tax=Podospora fimiseda TaxID=252190 RepID=A0AAN7BMA6_9PEZI|nr:hypothetical protein QBC38DRAFT_367425 [Podospora fimiseda]